MREGDMRTSSAGWRSTAAAMAMVAACATDSKAADNGPATSVPTTTTRRVVVSIPDRRLALVENDRVVRVYPVAVGAAESPSPVGTFTIVTRIANPTYYRPGVVIGPGAANPLGTRWI